MDTSFKNFLLQKNPDIFESRDLRDLSRTLGMEKTLQLVEEFGGSSICVPKSTSLKKAIRIFIQENIGANNINLLARKIGISVRYAYKILAEIEEKAF